MGASVVSGAPFVPRIAALAGQFTVVATVSPGLSAGMIERGDHRIFHVPEVSLRCNVLWTVSEPMVPSTRWLVIGVVAFEPEVETAPASCVAAVRWRSLATARLKEAKSDGGFATSRAIDR